MTELNKSAKATNYETIKHIQQVQSNLFKLVYLLLERGRLHDRSKLESPELEYFVKFTDRLKNLTYGSEEYKKNLEEISPALAHHFANNRHHPEHFPDGINNMNLIDVVEMLCDWKASASRQNNGNLRLTISMNAEKFKIEPQFLKVLENTLDLLDG
jgi:hypothetical protein